jgi:hypothetical protein
VDRGSLTRESCLQQPTRTVRIGHGSPPVSSSGRTPKPAASITGFAKPSQAFAHRRASNPGNAFPGTVASSREYSASRRRFGNRKDPRCDRSILTPNNANSSEQPYNYAMPTEKIVSDEALLEMRWRCLSLAADLDRVDRAHSAGGDPRLMQLREAISVLLDAVPDRARRVQMIFSDTTPPPPYRKSRAK